MEFFFSTLFPQKQGDRFDPNNLISHIRTHSTCQIIGIESAEVIFLDLKDAQFKKNMQLIKLF